MEHEPTTTGQRGGATDSWAGGGADAPDHPRAAAANPGDARQDRHARETAHADGAPASADRGLGLLLGRAAQRRRLGADRAPLQTPDEPGHVAYVQHVAESGKPPPGGFDLQHFSQEERRLLDAIRWKAIQRKQEDRVPGTASFHKRVEADVATPAERLSEGGYTTDINNPPLYYFAAAGVYHASPWTSLPDRIHAIRLFSALLAAITVLFVFLFLRELIPSTPWAWTVGALAVAFQPMFGFTSSGVTSERGPVRGIGGNLLPLRALLPPVGRRHAAGLRSGRLPRSGCSPSST